MRRIWAQKLRPRLSLHNQACADSLSILSRRTTSAPGRRRLQLRDAFTILLTPILTTAFIVDLSWKDQRRKEWDAKIASLISEVETFQADERERWCALQRRSVALGATLQRRSYMTAAAAASKSLNDMEWEEEIDLPTWTDPATSAAINIAGEPATQPDDSIGGFESEHIQMLKRVRTLLALRMAFRLLFRIEVGSSPRFDSHGVSVRYKVADMNSLAAKLREIELSLRSLRGRAAWDPTAEDPVTMEPQIQLDSRLKALATDLGKANLTISQFWTHVAEEILNLSVYPSLKGYTTILRALSLNGFGFGSGSLVDYVISAMRGSYRRLDSDAIYHILLHYGRNSDAHHFNRFLRELTRTDVERSHGIQWQWRVIDEIQVPVPMPQNSRLLQVLVYTALKCDQPHKAEAWASFLRAKNFGLASGGYVINDFLRYYAARANWRDGRAWLLHAVDAAPSLGQGSQLRKAVRRIIFAMLNLCVSCGKRDTYSNIMDAAVTARIGVYKADSDRVKAFSDRGLEILSEWQRLEDDRSADPALRDDFSVPDFQLLLRPELKKLIGVQQETAGTGPNILQNSSNTSPNANSPTEGETVMSIRRSSLDKSPPGAREAALERLQILASLQRLRADLKRAMAGMQLHHSADSNPLKKLEQEAQVLEQRTLAQIDEDSQSSQIEEQNRMNPESEETKHRRELSPENPRRPRRVRPKLIRRVISDVHSGPSAASINISNTNSAVT